jgi:helicase
LAYAGLPQEVVDQWTATFPGGLNALQLRAVNEFGVLNGNSLLVVAPTSSGKTLASSPPSARSQPARRPSSRYHTARS